MQLAKFPTLHFVFHDSVGGEVVVHVEPSAYLEHQGSNRYVPRVYLTEGSGSVLGANFMQVSQATKQATNHPAKKAKQ